MKKYLFIKDVCKEFGPKSFNDSVLAPKRTSKELSDIRLRQHISNMYLTNKTDTYIIKEYL